MTMYCLQGLWCELSTQKRKWSPSELIHILVCLTWAVLVTLMEVGGAGQLFFSIVGRIATKTQLRRLGLQIIDHQTTNNPRIEHKLWFCFSTTAHSSLAIWVGLHNFSTRKSVIAAISEQPWDWISTAAAALFTTTSNWSWINAGSLEKIKTTKKQRQRKRKIQKQRLN